MGNSYFKHTARQYKPFDPDTPRPSAIASQSDEDSARLKRIERIVEDKALLFDTMLEKSTFDPEQSRRRHLSMLIIDDPQGDICDHDLDRLQHIDDLLVRAAKCLNIPICLLKGEPMKGTKGNSLVGNHHYSNRPCAPVDLSQTPLAGPDRWHAKGDAKND